MAKKRGKKLTDKQRAFVAGKVDGLSDYHAARQAGYSEYTARAATATVKKKPAVQAAFARILRKAGISDTLLATRLREGLDAQDTKFFPQVAQGKIVCGQDGEPIATQLGPVREAITADDIPRVDLVNFTERREHVELVMKLTGRIPRDVAEERPPIQIAIIHVDKEV